MSRPIQSLAPGFLGMLGMKNEGRLPPDMVDAVAPVVELLPFYVMGNRETLAASAAVNVLAAAVNYVFVEFTVPAQEVWYVHGFNVQVGVPAGQSWTGAIIHFNRSAIPIRTGSSFTVGGAAAGLAAPQSLGGFFAAAGDLFGLATELSAGAGAENAFGYMTISRFLA